MSLSIFDLAALKSSSRFEATPNSPHRQRRDISLELVFPNSKNVPPQTFQRSGDQAISRSVAGELSRPKPLVLPRQCTVLRTAMPKAPINEYYEFFGPKDEVWPAEQR